MDDDAGLTVLHVEIMSIKLGLLYFGGSLLSVDIGNSFIDKVLYNC